ncbi:HEAT repeat domain-containing protein [Photobacterium sp. CCB-ST2H9]|uniref:HEAT repeat domain-containing protein n=1 Tax=Photobacterium sp. CCB-ST2H9 TaxID=2912855 RepID=UPI002002C67E|nr:HEAT repeat domain-containing protein [Photobacterium sp. CCB-ST2H9]UTM57407.1 HEAT repeat domain-containing protein [Photobacterium sp. CCB-ST2H9]
MTSLMGQGHSYQPDLKVNYSYTGQVFFDVLEQTAQGYTLAFRFQSESFIAEMNGNTSSRWPQDMVVYANLNRDGLFNELKFQEEYYEEFSPLLKDMIAQFQISLSNQGKSNWQTIEADFSSAYDVYYEIDKALIPGWDIRVNKSYRPQNALLRLEQAVDIDVSRFSKRISQIVMDRSKETYSASGKLAEEKAHFSAVFLSVADVPEADSQTDTIYISDTLNGEYQRQLLEKQMYEQTVGTENVTTFSTRLRQVPSLDNRGKASLFYQLRAWVALDPSRLEQVKLWLSLYQADHPAFQMLSTLLVSIGSPEAQNILLDVMAASSPEKQNAIMLKLIFLDHPTLESESAVRDLAKSLPSEEERLQAQLVLGGMARFLQDDDRARSLAIFEEVKGQLTASSDAQHIEDALSVIGNMGLAEQTDVVTGYLSHESKQVRYSALDALRFVNTPKAQGVLLKHLSDDDGRMREISSTGLSFTTPGPEFVDVYRDRLKVENNEYVIRQLIDNLGQMSVQYPESIKVLKDYIPNIGITSLKNYAEGVLNNVQSNDE